MYLSSLPPSLPPFPQLAVLREPDHYHRWIPLMDKSKVVKRLGKIEQMVWFRVAGAGYVFLPSLPPLLPSLHRSRYSTYWYSLLPSSTAFPLRVTPSCTCMGAMLPKRTSSFSPGPPCPRVRLQRRWMCGRPRRSGTTHESISSTSAFRYVLPSVLLSSLPLLFVVLELAAHSFALSLLSSLQLKIISPTHCKIDLIYKLDVKLKFVPQAVINYFSKFTCGWVIWFLFQEVR